MELVDIQDLKSWGHLARAGSSPAPGTINKMGTFEKFLPGIVIPRKKQTYRLLRFKYPVIFRIKFRGNNRVLKTPILFITPGIIIDLFFINSL